MGFDFILHNLHTPSWYWTYMWDVSFVWRGVFLRTFQISLASSGSCIRGLCSIWPFILVPWLQPTDWSFWLFTTKIAQLLKASCSKISIRHQSVAAYPERNETFPPWYCGWASKILHRLVDGKHPIIYRVSTFQGGSGFLPSTVLLLPTVVGCKVEHKPCQHRCCLLDGQVGTQQIVEGWKSAHPLPILHMG